MSRTLTAGIAFAAVLGLLPACSPTATSSAEGAIARTDGSASPTETLAPARVEAAAAAPVDGAAGIGDPYWPLDGNGGLDVRHYDVAVSHDLATGRLSGTTTLTVVPSADLATFHLDLLLPVSDVRVDGLPAPFTKPDPHEVEVAPALPLTRGVEVEVEVTYAGTPGSLQYAGERNWLADEREVVTINEPHMAPWWFAANDHPRDKATFDITVTGPATHQVVSNGRLVGRTVAGTQATTHWRSARPMTTYNAFFALGRYDVEQSVRGGLPSYVAVSRDLPAAERSRAMRDLRRSDEITAWLARRLGPYPFESTGGLVTALPVQFALENQTRPVYPGAPGTTLLVHELAHQWFGDSVSVQRWRDIWLNEGFATFMEVYYDERTGGQRAQQWLRENRRGLADFKAFWRLDLTDPGSARIFDNAVYQRGAMALQALRHRIGDKPFWRVMRTWVRDHRYANATVGSFAALAEEVHGRPLDGLFRAWLRTPRPPAVTSANGLR